MSPSVTAVIPHWYEERVPALREAVRALLAGTVVPETVLIWDNTGNLELDATDPAGFAPPVMIVSSPTNIGPKARFLAALMAETEYVFFQDNDLVVEKETIANLVGHAERNVEEMGEVLTLEGRRARPGVIYRHWDKVYGHGLTCAVPVDLSLGRAELVPQHLLPEILRHFPWDPETAYDDLWFSWCAKKAGIPLYVVPAVKGVSSLRDLQTYVGLCTEPGYYERRDQVAQALFGGGGGSR